MQDLTGSTDAIVYKQAGLDFEKLSYKFKRVKINILSGSIYENQ